MDLPFGYTHSNKRSHAQMDLEDSASPRWSPFSDHSPAIHEPSAGAPRFQNTNINLPHVNLVDPIMPRRYPGDGLDHRRPVSSSDVIDLTEEDAVPNPSFSQPAPSAAARPPRFGRDIIEDIIDLAADEPQEISGSRSRPIDLDAGDGDGDEVRYLGEQTRSFPDNFTQAMMTLPRIRAVMDQRRQAERQRQAISNRFAQNAARSRSSSNNVPRPPPRIPRPLLFEFRAPTLQYDRTAFALRFPPDEPLSPDPTYEAPPKAPDGFTRSPQEEDSLICPNCEDELCVGSDEQKRQVWIVKQCGHVYCGECTLNRFVTKTGAKGKERQLGSRKHFKECVVEGCNKKVSQPKSMIQVFL